MDPGEVTFKVEKNSKGYSAIDVARRVGKSIFNISLIDFLYQKSKIS